jgi:hypothetical protein
MPAYRVFFTITFEPMADDGTHEAVTLKGEYDTPDDMKSEEDADEWFQEFCMNEDETQFVDVAGAEFWKWEDGFETVLEITDSKLIK